MFPIISFLLLLPFLFVFLFLLRFFLHRTALIFVFKKWMHWVEDNLHVHQSFKVPEFNENLQDNQFYRKVLTYVNSLASVEDSDFTNLLSGKKSNDIVLCLDDNQTVHDTFLGTRVSWKYDVSRDENRSFSRTFLLRIKKKDKRRILRPYLNHIHSVSDDIEQRWRELKLFINAQSDHHRHTGGNGRWLSVPFTHPSTLDTIAMDLDLKNKVKSDLESFLKSKQYYHRLGRVWKRSYLLYGPSGTGKSCFIAAMAKLLCYDIYDVDLSKVSDDSDLKMLLLQTTSKSVIVIEDLDRFVNRKSTSVSLSGVLNFMDGIVNSCCGDEKVMVCTMNGKEEIDPAVLRPGRIDFHIYFPLCDFNSFKSLANSYLGVKDHKLFPQVEEMFQTGATLSPAEIGEIMIVNRSSPSRALRSVITALQSTGASSSSGGGGRKIGQRLSESVSSRPSAEEMGHCESVGSPWKETPPALKEFRRLYGLLKLKSTKRCAPSDSDLVMIKR